MRDDGRAPCGRTPANGSRAGTVQQLSEPCPGATPGGIGLGNGPAGPGERNGPVPRTEPSRVDARRTETSPSLGRARGERRRRRRSDPIPGGRARGVSVRLGLGWALAGLGWTGLDGAGRALARARLGSAPQWRGGARPRARGGSARGAEAAAKMAARVSQGPAARGRS